MNNGIKSVDGRSVGLAYVLCAAARSFQLQTLLNADKDDNSAVAGRLYQVGPDVREAIFNPYVDCGNVQSIYAIFPNPTRENDHRHGY